MENVVMVKPGEWESLEGGSKPIFADFWAKWCAPCRMVAPTVEKLAAKYCNDVLFVKVDVDDLPDLAAKFGVRSIPTLLLLKDRKEAARWVGARSYEELVKGIEAHLLSLVKN